MALEPFAKVIQVMYIMGVRAAAAAVFIIVGSLPAASDKFSVAVGRRFGAAAATGSVFAFLCYRVERTIFQNDKVAVKAAHGVVAF